MSDLRELDIKLGAGLFSYQWVKTPWNGAIFFTDAGIGAIEGDEILPVAPENWRDLNLFDLPYYSSKLIDAWQIVEHFQRPGMQSEGSGYHWVLKTPFGCNPKRPDKYHAGITPHECSGWNGRPDFLGSGDSMPEAIARCAALWLDTPRGKLPAPEATLRAGRVR